MEILIQRTNQVRDRNDGRQLFLVLAGIYESLRSQFLTPAGLAIGTPTTAVRTAATVTHACVQGVLRAIPANTLMPALAGTVTNGTFNIFLFTMNRAGAFFTQMGTAGSTLANVRWPPIAPDRAIVGFVIINPTGTGNFVGGTTALDNVTVIPNAAFVSPVGAFRPSADLGI